MSISIRGRMVLGFALANVSILAVAGVLYLGKATSPPQIQGVLLPNANPLPAFELFDQQGQRFTNKDLVGRWHLVSYGFTTCPDICPTILSELATTVTQLGSEADDLRVLFYTIDHRRDTVGQLASYLSYFNDSFVGLTHFDDPANPHLPFEQSLGMVSRLVPDADPDSRDYTVLHGFNLFLLNPQGELQAVFQPGRRSLTFEPTKLAADYLAVREYVVAD